MFTLYLVAMTSMAYVAGAVIDVATRAPFNAYTSYRKESGLFFLQGLILAASLLARGSGHTGALLLDCVLAVLYTVLALCSWRGLQNWGSTSHNLAMALWDMALAVTYLSWAHVCLVLQQIPL